MATIAVHHDPADRSLVMWFGNPEAEVVCEELDNGVVLMKDGSGRVIGVELIGYEPGDSEPLTVTVAVHGHPVPAR